MHGSCSHAKFCNHTELSERKVHATIDEVVFFFGIASWWYEEWWRKRIHCLFKVKCDGEGWFWKARIHWFFCFNTTLGEEAHIVEYLTSTILGLDQDQSLSFLPWTTFFLSHIQFKLGRSLCFSIFSSCFWEFIT